MRIVEFYPEQQGRPGSKVQLDNESRGPSIPAGSITGVMLNASYTSITQVNNYTATNSTVILCDCSGGVIIVTLPSASVNNGRYYHIKKTDGSSNKVIVRGNVSAETIDGEVDVSIGLQYGYGMVYCNGTVW